MTRDISPGMDAAIQSNNLGPVYFCDFEFAEGELNLWAGGIGTILWNGKTYTGGATLLKIDAAPETTSLEARGAAFVLTGQDDTVRSLALQVDARNRPCGLYLGALDLANMTIVSDPILMFSGRMDVFNIDDDPGNATIGLSAEPRTSLLRKNKVRRFTPEDQALQYPDDTGLRFVAGLQDKKIIWG